MERVPRQTAYKQTVCTLFSRGFRQPVDQRAGGSENTEIASRSVSKCSKSDDNRLKTICGGSTELVIFGVPRIWRSRDLSVRESLVPAELFQPSPTRF